MPDARKRIGRGAEHPSRTRTIAPLSPRSQTKADHASLFTHHAPRTTLHYAFLRLPHICPTPSVILNPKNMKPNLNLSTNSQPAAALNGSTIEVLNVSPPP